MPALRLVFTASTGPTGTELFLADAATGTARLVVDAVAGTASGTPIRAQDLGNGVAVFQLTGGGIWVSDGTAPGSRRLADGTELTVIRPGVAVFDAGDPLGYTDGSTAGTGTTGNFGSGSDQLGARVSYVVQGAFEAQPDGSALFRAFRSRSNPFTSSTDTLSTDAYTPPGAVASTLPRFTFGPFFTTGVTSLGNNQPGAFATLATGDVSGWGRLTNSSIAFGMAPQVAGVADARGVELYASDGTVTGTRLVLDINPTGSSRPADFSAAGQGRAAFTADAGGGLGREPWITDGTPGGARALGDLAAGAAASGAFGFTALGNTGRFVFAANDGVNGSELWVSDGSVAGTMLLADIRPGAAASAPASFAAMADGRVVFSATTDRNGREPWVTDGTLAGTRLLADVNAAPRGLPGVQSFTDFGAGKLYFSAGASTALTWLTDGTAAGTQLMRSTAAAEGFLITSGAAPSSTPGSFIFLARVNSQDYIARGDGTLAGTSIIAAPVTSPVGIVSLPGGRALTVGTVDGAAASLVVTDGTLAGTAKLGALSFQGGALLEGQSISKVVNGYRYFAAVGDATGNELWRTDGTQAGTTLVADVDPRVLPTSGTFVTFGSAPTSFTAAGGLVYFIAQITVLTITPTLSHALWRTDGTAAGTIDLTGNTGTGFSRIRAMEGFGSSLLYETYGLSGTTINFNYSITDGSGLGSSTLLYTVPVANGFGSGTPNGAAIRQISPGHALIAGDYSGLSPNVLLGTDGTAAGTGPLGSFTQLSNASGPAGTPYYAVLGNGQALFIANNGTTGLELWHTDGTPSGTALVTDATPGAGSTVFGRMSILDNGTAAFGQIAGGVRSIIISDGSTAGTRVFLTLTGTGTALPDEFDRLPDGRLVYRFNDGVNGTQPWVSDGTAAGTRPLYDPTITGDSNPTGFAEVSFIGDQIFTGTEGRNTLRPGNWNDTVLGLGGDDILFQGIGDNLFDGGPGFDRLDATAMGFRGMTVARAGSDTRLGQSGQNDTLRGIEQVDLADGRLVFDAGDAAAQVTRLYQAALARLPDQVGLNGWIAQLQASGTLTDVARGFSVSAEFTNRFGTGLSNGQYVDQLYQNVLGRAGEAAGRQGWLDFLGRGASREEVLAGFSESPENRGLTQPLVDAGIWDLSENAGRVARLYDAIMGRLPDIGGMNTWRAALDGGASLVDVTRGFTGSAEFATRYGNPNNTNFVTLLYRNTLEREPDAGGLAYWTGELARGVSRAEVIIGFSESAEEIALTKGAIMNESPGSFGILFA